jgi:PAS domain S-box-containing protein
VPSLSVRRLPAPLFLSGAAVLVAIPTWAFGLQVAAAIGAAALAASVALWALADRCRREDEPAAEGPDAGRPPPSSPLTSALRRYQAIFERAPMALWVEEGGRVVDVNQAGCARAGRPRADLLGRPLSEVVPAEDVAAASSADLGAGTEARLHAVAAGSGQARRERDGRLEAVGRFSGVLAHDLNNILTAILGYAELLKVTQEDPAKRALFIDQVIEGGGRAGHFARRLSALGWRRPFKGGPQDVNELLREAEGAIFARAGDRVAVVFDLAPALPVVPLDTGRVRHAVECLVENAIEAMPEGGRLTLRTAPAGDGGVLVEVADTGCGMSEDVRERAFEPFFSTKARSVGVGLGLTIVHSTLAGHGGTVELDRQVPTGTVVRLRFPVAPVVPAQSPRVERVLSG